MHRSRPLVLATVAAVLAACSTHDDSKGIELLSKDTTLVARLGNDRSARPLPLPDVCGAIPAAARPVAANQQQARELIRQAESAEMHGDVSEARSLLRRASALDGTNKSAAYHLGRASEALGDSAAAVTAYCHYLALSPTTSEADEARQRLTTLSPAVTRISAGSVTDSVGTHRTPAAASVASTPTMRAATSGQRARASRPIARAERGATAAVGRASSERSSRGAEAVSSGPSSAAPSEPSPTTRDAGAVTTTGASAGDVVATSAPEPAVDQPTAPSRTARRGPSRAQGAVIGAATGAIIGAATGRSVKGAVIGAAAGGMLGGVIIGRGGALGPGTGTWASRVRE